MSRQMVTSAVVLLLALAAVCGTSCQSSGRVVADEEIEELIRKLGNEERGVRISAAEALGEMGPAAEDAIPALMRALGDEDAVVRGHAAYALGKMGPAAVPAFIKALAEGNKHARFSAALVLGKMGSEDAIPALIKALGDEYEAVRICAAEALGKMGPAAENAIPELEKLLSDEDETVREVAEEAIEKIQQGVEGTATESEQADPFAEVPTEKECEEIDARAQEFLKGAKTSRLTIYAVYVMNEPARNDPAAAKMLAGKLEGAGFQQVTVLENPGILPFEQEPNELNIFWKRARAFASQVQARPLDTDYVLVVDVFADFEKGAVGPVHAATTNAQGQFAYLALRNSHHPVYREIQPKSMDDMCRLVIEDMRRKMEGEASQSAQRVWQ